MNKDGNIKNNIIIVALCTTIVLIGIGFIILSINYKNQINKNHSYKVIFTNIKKSSSVKGGNIEPKADVKILDNSSEIEMKISLNSVHDELSYIATIENKGTMPVEIVDILESPDYKLNSLKSIINPVTISLSDIKGKVIQPKDTLELKILFFYNNSNNVSPKTFDYKIGLITRSR